MATSDRNADDLFFAALEIENAAARAAFLEESCGADAALRGRIERLLAANSHVGRFLEPPTVATTEARGGPSPLGAQEQVVGPYKLLELIGEGGMGTVYMAEQTAPLRRTVALKVIKAGMDSRQVLARFEAERQALALMDHPNIARVLDAGTTEQGRPYFVMELVKGVPITDFCDKRRLTLRERLELFIPVCQAVQHAHQKGIIHRDLKPSNVLVALYDGVPVPKVIDFGVAKATGQKLTEATLFTGFGAVVGTPEYMSPEQAELNQLDVDTRSDVYSLGVLLYELLTGTTPLAPRRLKEAAILEVLRVIREEEPPRPSTRLSTTEELPSIAAERGVEPRKLAGLVRGELDWVVMKALEKDRDRRYETANGLAADLRRYLDDESVAACPPSVRYRLGKLARRNKGLLATAAVVLVALLAGTAVATWQAVRATSAECRTAAALVEARDGRQAARQAVDEMYTQVAEKWLSGQPALTQLQREFLEKALEFYGQIDGTDSQDPEIRYEAARASYRAGVIRLNLGRFGEAEAGLRRAVNLADDLARRHPDRPDVRLTQAEGRVMLVSSLRKTGRSSNPIKGVRNTQGGDDVEFATRAAEGPATEAGQQLRQAAAEVASLGSSVPDDAAYRVRLAKVQVALSSELTLARRLPEAEAAARAAIENWEALVRDSPGEIDHRYGLASAYSRLGNHLMWWGGRNAEAEAAFQETDARLSELLKERPGDQRFRGALAQALTNRAVVLTRLDRQSEAESITRRALEHLERLAAEFPDVPDYRSGLETALTNLGRHAERQGRDQEAEGRYRRALDVNQTLAESHPDVIRYRLLRGNTHQDLLRSLLRQGKLGEARHVYDEGLQLTRAFMEERPGLKDARVSYRSMLVSGVRLMVAAGDREAARGIAAERSTRLLEEFTKDQLGDPVVSFCESQAEARPEDTPAMVQANHLLTRALILEAVHRGLDDPRALRRLADLMTAGPEELRDPELALRFARRAIELEPGDETGRRSLGWALYRAGDWKGCLENLKSEDDFCGAMAYRQSGDPAKARGVFDHADKALVAYEESWKPGGYPTPTMLRRMRDEAAALLGHETSECNPRLGQSPGVSTNDDSPRANRLRSASLRLDRRAAPHLTIEACRIFLRT